MCACEGIVDRVDRFGRTNRGRGVTEPKITHSPKGFLPLPNVKDRATAKGCTELSGVLGIMALSREDLRDLSEVQPLNERKIDTVAGFNAPQSWKQKRSLMVVRCLLRGGKVHLENSGPHRHCRADDAHGNRRCEAHNRRTQREL